MPQIRVRFAPSPTGFVHIGSLRTALYNFVYARKNKGACILRIEDTDQSRSVKGAVENLFDTMGWSGIEFDESIYKEGDFGPYQQSLRLDIYKKYVQQLIDRDKAYPCFASAEELEEMREKQIARGLDPKYDGRYRDLDKTEAAVRMQKETHVIRMKIPEEGEVVFQDIIRGEVRFRNELLDDQIILKSDGYPTYHLANVVDDHLMQISHVIRGEEWLPSTPKHILLYRFFDWDMPQFAHLPLLLNMDRSKLSKRQGDVAVEDYRAKGYLPQALINYVALLGWSAGKGDQEIFSMDELIDAFSLENVNKAGAIFDINKLDWMNGHYIRQLPPAQAIDFFNPYLDKAGIDTSDIDLCGKIIQAIKPRINKADEIAEAIKIFISDDFEIKDPESVDIIKTDTALIVLKSFLEKVEKLDSINSEVFLPLMKDIQTEQNIKGPLLWKPVRVALTGQVSGPELPLVIDIFGKEKICNVLNRVINQLKI